MNMTWEIITVKLSYTKSFGQEFESKIWKLVHFGIWREFLVLICNSRTQILIALAQFRVRFRICS